jgi:hypothetical protein
MLERQLATQQWMCVVELHLFFVHGSNKAASENFPILIHPHPDFNEYRNLTAIG